MLLTGFEPYGGRGTNPATRIAEALDGEVIAGTRVRSALLPVDYPRMSDEIDRLLRETAPVAVISLGLWPGEPVIRLERFGLNFNDFEIPDNAGIVESGSIEPGGPDARAATLPLDTIWQRLLSAGIPARFSSSAGNFLCNALLYKTLGILERNGSRARCGFIHVPYLPEQVAEVIATTRAERTLELHQRADLASMALDTMVAALRIAIEATLEAAR